MSSTEILRFRPQATPESWAHFMPKKRRSLRAKVLECFTYRLNRDPFNEESRPEFTIGDHRKPYYEKVLKALIQLNVSQTSYMPETIINKIIEIIGEMDNPKKMKTQKKVIRFHL